MANKNVTMTEPVANDVVRLDVRCDGAGNISFFGGSVSIASTDENAAHVAEYEMLDPSTISGAEASAISTLVAYALAQYKTQYGF